MSAADNKQGQQGAPAQNWINCVLDVKFLIFFCENTNVNFILKSNNLNKVNDLNE